MSERQQFLSTVPQFEALAPVELAIVAEIVSVVEWQAGADVFTAGDTADAMCVVPEGVIEVYTVVSGIEKLFMTVREGGVFGLLSLIDSENPRASGRLAAEHPIRRQFSCPPAIGGLLACTRSSSSRTIPRSSFER